ncbi:MAG: cytochrome P450 [Saprospiraceae bacterium]
MKTPATNSSTALHPPKINPAWSTYRGMRYPTSPIPSLNLFREKCGNTYQILVGSRGWAVVSEDATIIDHVLRINNKNYLKSPIVSEILAKYIGHGLLTIDGPFWRKQRKLIQPGFSRERLANLVNTIDEEASAWASGLIRGTAVNLYGTTLPLAMQVMARVLFTDKISDAELHTVARSVELGQIEFAKEIRQPILKFWRKLTSSKAKADVEAKKAVDILLQQINTHRANPGTYQDLLQMLIDARYEDGTSMSDAQLVDEVLVLILAGHETTAVSLACTIHLLAEHPTWQAKVQEEWEEVIGNTGAEARKLQQLPILTAVIKEGMRLYPPAYLVSRMAIGDDEVEGVKIKAGQIVINNVYGAHRNSINFDNERTFDPTRYLERRTTTNFGFGGGPRMCVGYHLAMMELQIAIGRTLGKGTFVKTQQTEIDFSASATLRPRNGVWVTLEQK